jgi:hypothetical protein
MTQRSASAVSTARSHDLSSTDLSPSRRRLLKLHQHVQFGEVRGLRIEAGEPVLSPFPEVLRDLLLGRSEESSTKQRSSEFSLKREFVDLFALFDRDQNFLIDRIVIQAGLPLRVRVRVSSVA